MASPRASRSSNWVFGIVVGQPCHCGRVAGHLDESAGHAGVIGAEAGAAADALIDEVERSGLAHDRALVDVIHVTCRAGIFVAASPRFLRPP